MHEALVQQLALEQRFLDHALSELSPAPAKYATLHANLVCLLPEVQLTAALEVTYPQVQVSEVQSARLVELQFLKLALVLYLD